MACVKHLFEKPSFVFITGASGGLGRTIAIELAAVLTAGSVITITARNENGLKETSVLALTERRNRNISGDVELHYVMTDLSKTEDIQKVMQSSLENRQASHFSTAAMILNFGSLGDISKEFCDFRDPEEITDYFRLNVSHIPVLVGEFLDWLNAGRTKPDTLIVNISSLAGILPMLNSTLYCSGKAARDMLLKVLAVENPSIRVLNWSPGPLLGTKMTNTLWSTPNKHKTDETMRAMRDEGKYLTCEQSTAKFMTLLRQDSYENGAHVDYYDVADD